MDNGKALAEIVKLINKILIDNHTGNLIIEFQEGEIRRWYTKLKNLEVKDLK